MVKEFLVKVVDENNVDLYKNHSSFHKGDSGLDLFIINDQIIKGGQTVLVDLGIQCQNRSFNLCVWQWFTKGFYKYNSYILMPRSSMAKTPLMVRNSIGLIDSAYTGPIKVALYNTSNKPFEIKRGERYVQLINADLSSIYMKMTNVIRNTTRGSGAFGSTNNSSSRVV
jgi:dUTP pyrophosphatase